MKIREFAKLCGCTPQTLRYYNQQNLLNPARVDEWNGYRYYDAGQALVYVKIKNLQKAGFTMSEVKELLNLSDTDIYRAFDRKIADEERRIKELKEIQMEYMTEMNKMETALDMLHRMISETKANYDPYEEFGIDDDEFAGVTGMLDELLASMNAEKELFKLNLSGLEENGKEAETADFDSFFDDEAYDVIFERHGWNFAKEFTSEIPAMNEEDEYLLLFRLRSSKPNKTAFANAMIWMCCQRTEHPANITCKATDSTDDVNYFWLLTRRSRP